MGKTQTFPYDGAEHFIDPAAQAELLEDAFASSDEAYIAQALRTISRARGMAERSREPGMSGERAGDPRLSEVLELARDLGLVLSLSPRSDRDVAGHPERR